MTQKQIVVIGGGPAGLEAARAAVKSGTAVTVISSEAPGGRAGWHSLLPSKVWLTAADMLGHLSPELGLAETAVSASPPAITARIKKVKARWNEGLQAELEALGVVFRRGTAVFSGPETIEIEQDGETETMTADAFIVASGSVPIFPPPLKPDGKRVIAPRFASALDSLPQSMIVIGGGATGTEFAYLFNRVGVDVTWVVDHLGVLPDFDPAAGALMAEILTARGVKLVAGQLAERIDRDDNGVAVVLTDGSRYEAEMAFVAIGRRPDVGKLNLDAAGAAAGDVDAYGRSANSRVYLVGDVSGGPMIANRAMAQAWVAGQHAAGAEVAPFQPETVVAAIYSEPQVAQVGTLSGDDVATVEVPFAIGLKAQLGVEAEGFVKLAYGVENGRLCGGAAIGDHAADVLAPVAVALQAEMTIAEFGRLFGAHPTVSELAFIAARQI